MQNVVLNNGVGMPIFGVGVFQVDNPKVCEQNILNALEIGYRSIDTVSAY